MLVLTRRLGEKLVLIHPDGTEVEVQVVDVDRGRVRLGVVAPREVKVLREELTGRKAAKKE